MLIGCLIWAERTQMFLYIFECTLFLQETILEKTAELAGKQDLDKVSVTGWAPVADLESKQGVREGLCVS